MFHTTVRSRKKKLPNRPRYTVKPNPTYQKLQEKMKTHDFIPQVIMQEGSQKQSERSNESIGAI